MDRLTCLARVTRLFLLSLWRLTLACFYRALKVPPPPPLVLLLLLVGVVVVVVVAAAVVVAALVVVPVVVAALVAAALVVAALVVTLETLMLVVVAILLAILSPSRFRAAAGRWSGGKAGEVGVASYCAGHWALVTVSCGFARGRAGIQGEGEGGV